MSNIALSVNIPQPKEIPIPEDFEQLNDQIVEIACGKRHSFLLSEDGKLWATGGFKEEKSSRLQQIKQHLGADDQDGEENKLEAARKDSGGQTLNKKVAK